MGLSTRMAGLTLLGVNLWLAGGCGTGSTGAMNEMFGGDTADNTPSAAKNGASDVELGDLFDAAVATASHRVYGNWVLDEGSILPNFDIGLDVVALTLEPSGDARVFFRDGYTDAIDCVRAYFVADRETLVLDLSAEPSVSFDPERTMYFPVMTVKENWMGVADETGQIAFLSRVDEFPDDLVCGELEVLDIYEGLPSPNSFGDLTLHFGDLIYNSNNDMIEYFDLDTNTLLAPLADSANRFIQAKQGLDFWTHCGCGGSPDVFRRSLENVFDTIHTGNDLDFEITVRAAEYIPTTDRLWLHGFADNSGNGYFLIVNAGAEPDVLDETIFFNRSVRGLSFDGTDLWALVSMASRSIVRIDPETGNATQSYELPDEDIFWTGIEFDQDYMYLIGTDPDFEGVLYRLARP